MIRLYLSFTGNLPDPAFAPELLKYLPKRRADDVLRIMPEEGRKQRLGAGLLLTKVLKEHGAAPEEVYYDTGGKPRHEKVKFSLSHSGELVALALSDSGEVGCDVEKIREVPENVIRIFSEKEQAALNELTDERKKHFFRLWTMRESYLKMTGEGLSGMGKIALSEDGIFRGGKLVSCFIRNYDVDGYSVSVCGEEDCFDPFARIVSLVNFFC